jgi:hypothetical protein
MILASHLAIGQQNGATAPLEKLGAFVGKWQGSGEMVNSAYSQAGKNSGETNCSWSPSHGFLICDQTVHLPSGTQNDLSLYTYNESDKSYAFFGHSRNDRNTRSPRLTIEGNIWTYANEFDEGSKHIKMRTVNEFKSPSLMLWRAEYSEDGTHWTSMGSGSMTRK